MRGAWRDLNGHAAMFHAFSGKRPHITWLTKAEQEALLAAWEQGDGATSKAKERFDLTIQPVVSGAGAAIEREGGPAPWCLESWCYVDPCSCFLRRALALSAMGPSGFRVVCFDRSRADY